MQRTKRSFYNVIVTMITNVIILGTAFLVQRALVASLGSDYNGVNGLFTSVISMMSLTDLGIGSAIIYHLYKPAAEGDYQTINSLLRFYRRSYMAISGIVLLIGCALTPFLPGIVGTVEIRDNLYLIFGLFLLDCLSSYFLSYKKSLLYAHQMSYVLDTIHFIYYMVQNAVQLLVLWYFKDYIAFLIVKTVSKCIENLSISFYIKKRYPDTNDKKIQPLKPEIKSDIIVKVKALLFHRLGKLFVTGSDSLVITGVLGITQMSLYTNYHLVIGGITSLLNKIFETLTYSVGNFLLDSNCEKRLELYKKIDFLNFWVFGCGTVVLYSTLQPVIELWMGDEYLFTNAALFALMLNFYQEGMRASVMTFKDAAGIYHEDRFIPIIEAALNVTASIILAKYIGITGVFAGTVISSAAVYLYSFPKYVCKPLFHMSYFSYEWRSMQHLIPVLISMFVTEYLLGRIAFRNPFCQIVAAALTSVAVFHVFLLVFFGRSRELKYYRDIIVIFLFRKEGENK